MTDEIRQAALDVLPVINDFFGTRFPDWVQLMGDGRLEIHDAQSSGKNSSTFIARLFPSEWEDKSSCIGFIFHQYGDRDPHLSQIQVNARFHGNGLGLYANLGINESNIEIRECRLG